MDHRSVLIIDDNQDLALSLSYLLEFHGCRVRVAFDGPEGLDLVQNNHFDVVIVDIGLPSMSGYEVALAIRSIDPEPPILLAQTAYGQAEDVRRSLDAGFDGHLVKPVPPAEIIRHVVEGRSALRKKPNDPGGGSKPTDVLKTPIRIPSDSANAKKCDLHASSWIESPRG
jgi:CheY-like chemotaxis protein